MTVHDISERSLQRTITDAAQLLGWHIYHTYDSRRSGPGFPDLLLVGEHPSKRGLLAAWELKSERGRLSPDQSRWLRLLDAVSGVDVRVVRPSDLDDALEWLRAPDVSTRL